MSGVENLMLYNDKGDVLPDENFLEHIEQWRKQHPGEFVFGPIVKHSWLVNGQACERENPRSDHFRKLPDSSGFLLCENLKRSDNLLLLDAHGNERMRLDVPWRMTSATNPECGKYPTGFVGLSIPYPNPDTGQEGKFGVRASVAGFYGQAFYFELDYHTGAFLWCYRLQRG